MAWRFVISSLCRHGQMFECRSADYGEVEAQKYLFCQSLDGRGKFLAKFCGDAATRSFVSRHKLMPEAVEAKGSAS